MNQAKLDRYRNDAEFSRLIKNGNYWLLMMAFGHDTILALLNEFELSEKYERCHRIKQAISYHNSMVNDTLPTR